MLILTTIAIFLSAALLFLVQPMIGKVLLPTLGGSPAVWNACMVFFQAALLAGYGYAHLVTTRCKAWVQVGVHVALLGAAAWLLPTPVNVGAPGQKVGGVLAIDGAYPTAWLLATLAWAVGLPFLAVSTSGPLLQKWFSRSGHRAAKDPYFLYAASNAGSLIGLVAYPFVIEPWQTRVQQASMWAYGFWGLGVLVAACGVLMAVRSGRGEVGGERPNEPAEPLAWGRRARWVALAAVPSSLMVGVTQYVSTDIAAVPLLWMLPLTIYLGSFIAAFSPKVAIGASVWGWVVPASVLATVCVMLAGYRYPIQWILVGHFVMLACVAMMCHRSLYEDRPGTSRLTEFYLWMSVGGVVGGAFNALVAPRVFDSVAEYPIAIAGACLLRPQVLREWRAMTEPRRRTAVVLALGAGLLVAVLIVGGFRAIGKGWIPDGPLTKPVTVFGPLAVCAVLLAWRGSLRFAAGIAVAGLLTLHNFSLNTMTVLQTRTFFGVLRVAEYSSPDPKTGQLVPRQRTLFHGSTKHGMQFVNDPSEPTINVEGLATTYYHRTGPIGQIIAMLNAERRLHAMGVVGLGTGTMATYGRPGAKLRFFEIDPAVVAIATDKSLFTNLTSSKSNIEIIGGDGRLSLGMRPDGEFDLLVIDAFSSDAIPVHLLTREAVELYMKKLSPDGVLAVHISNRYFQLAPVLRRHADALGLVARGCYDVEKSDDDKLQGKEYSHWVALARRPGALGRLVTDPACQEKWLEPVNDPTLREWTDDYSNIIGTLHR